MSWMLSVKRMWVPCSPVLLHQEDRQVQVEEEQCSRQVLGEQEEGEGEGVILSRDVVPLDQEEEVAVLQGLEEEVEEEDEEVA